MRGMSGHTILELLVVVAIITIIAVVAIPSYESYAQKGRREQLKATMLDVAAAQERAFAVRGRYLPDISQLTPFGLPAGTVTAGGYQIGEDRILFHVYLKQIAGPGFVVIGKTDIDKSADTTEECWYYFSRNLPRPVGADGDLLWVHDDVTNETKAVVADLPSSDLCKWE